MSGHWVKIASLSTSPICAGNKHIVVLFIVLWMKLVALVHYCKKWKRNSPKAGSATNLKFQRFQLQSFHHKTTSHHLWCSRTTKKILVVLCTLSSVICLSAIVTTSGKYLFLMVTPFFVVGEKGEDNIPSTSLLF